MKKEFTIRNNLIKFPIKGSDVKELIEYSEKNLFHTGGYLRFSGIDYILDKDNNVTINKINGKNFDMDKEFVVSSSGALLVGIDNIPVLKKIGDNIPHIRTMIESGTSIYNIIMSKREFDD